MSTFLLALALFLALHSIPAIPPIRAGLVAIAGRRAYLFVYSLASVASLAWVFHAAFALDYVELWPPAPWQAWIAVALVPVALFLLIAGLISSNPLSISFRRRESRPGAIVSITRHPVLWGFFLWALGHVVANGDLRSLLLFGSLGLFAIMGMAITERRNRRRLGAEWATAIASSSVLPFVAIVQRRARLNLDRALLASLAAAMALTAVLLAGGHAALFAADPLLMAAP